MGFISLNSQGQSWYITQNHIKLLNSNPTPNLWLPILKFLPSIQTDRVNLTPGQSVWVWLIPISLEKLILAD